MKFIRVLPLLVGLLWASCASKNIAGNPSLQNKTIRLMTSAAAQKSFRNWDSLGFHAGEKVPNFTLYSLYGDKFDLYKTLRRKKTLLLITGSYTCDISRSHLEEIKAFQTSYADKLDIVLIYTIDAHPSNVPSPYSEKKEVWIVKNNIRDKVEAKQPTTYAERVALAKKWKERYHINASILIDSHTNDYWSSFGQAPNMAYLINPDGKVYYRQIWFEKTGLEKNISLLRPKR